MIILKKIQVTMKAFGPPFFNHFRSVNRKKCLVMTAMRKKTFTLQLPIGKNRIGNLKWCKCGHYKNEATEIDCLWWMQCILIRLKTHSARVASRHQLLWATAQLLVTCFSLIYLVDEFSFLLLE